ncbi:Pentatricopeptide repeat-containing protein [Diplonema papillatum]|nr:Pentatricopeptide repeat-containing protein [Diplonema papillatum]
MAFNSAARQVSERLRHVLGRRWAYSSTHQDRRYDTGRTDGAAANYIKHKYKLHRNEIKGKRLWEIKANSREVMDQGRAMIGELRAMKGAGWEIGPMTYTSAVSVFASYGLSKWAHRMLEEMINDDMEPGRETFNALIWAYAENGEVRGIQVVWDQMKERGVQPDNITYNVVMMGLLKSGNKHVAFRMFELMKQEGLVPDVQFYNTLVTACDTAEEAWAVVNKMKSDNVHPDQFTFYFLMKLSATTGDVRGAEETLRQLANYRVMPTSAHWTILLVAYRTAGDYEGSLRVWERMKDAGIKPTGGTLTELFRAQEMEAVRLQKERGELHEARLAEAHMQGYSGDCVKSAEDLETEAEAEFT